MNTDKQAFLSELLSLVKYFSANTLTKVMASLKTCLNMYHGFCLKLVCFHFCVSTNSIDIGNGSVYAKKVQTQACFGFQEINIDIFSRK